ncbi:MAG: aspartyl/glutamyl-tRNA amidotransferase subunit C [Thaumarchaeota archaeon]|nr:aspartyl/glutamyl-tRNA amidotransferase subunit C [Nitrososphaerota archaeon]
MSRKPEAGVSLEEVRRLASLSRLTMTRPEEERLREELSSILDYFRVVDGVSGHIETGRLAEEAALLRPDEVRPSDPEGVLRGVPHKKGRLVRAPRVF